MEMIFKLKFLLKDFLNLPEYTNEEFYMKETFSDQSEVRVIAENLRFEIGDTDSTPLNFEANKNELVIVKGPAGSGKVIFNDFSKVKKKIILNDNLKN